MGYRNFGGVGGVNRDRIFLKFFMGDFDPLEDKRSIEGHNRGQRSYFGHPKDGHIYLLFDLLYSGPKMTVRATTLKLSIGFSEN